MRRFVHAPVEQPNALLDVFREQHDGLGKLGSSIGGIDTSRTGAREGRMP
jgi:hypothetical protein